MTGAHRVQPLPPGPAVHAARPPIPRGGWAAGLAALTALAGIALAAVLLAGGDPATSTPTSAQTMTARTSTPGP